MGGTVCATLLLLFMVLGCEQNEQVVQNAPINKKAKVVKKVNKRVKSSTSKKKVNLVLSKSLMTSLLECALDTGNTQSIKLFADKYRNHPDPKKRMEFIEALIQFDQDGLPYLANFIKDPDPEVAEHALTFFESQIDIIEEPTLKSSILGQAILNTTDNDSLKILTAKLELLPPATAVQQIAIICQLESSHPEVVKAVKKEYETITGEPFTSIADAKRWARKNR